MISAQVFMLWELNSRPKTLHGSASGSDISDKEVRDDWDSP